MVNVQERDDISGDFHELISADLAVSLVNSWKFQTAKHMNNSRRSSQWGSSLKNLKWDQEDKPLSLSERLISSTVHEWYDAKHRKASEEEITFVNSIPVSKCPHCGSTHVIRYGIYPDHLQCYRCKECNRKFSPLTNTIFADKKIPISEWIEYLLHLFEFHSLRTSARDNRNAESTGRYWITKVFSILEDIQDEVVLEGNVYIDEMFFPVIKHQIIIKDGKKLRGISRNKICVAAGFDDHGNVLLINECVSKPSLKSTWKAYGNHIKQGSHLIHDDEHSHSILVKNLSLTEEVHSSNQTRGLDDKENPLDPINNLHDLSKRYMRAHGGYDRTNLQAWMNLIWLILSEPQDRYEKVKSFIEMASDSPQLVRYRAVMSKKSAD